MHAMPLNSKPPRALHVHHRRTLRVTAAVLLGHVGLIWLASTGLLSTVAPPGDTEQTLMASVVMEMSAPPSPVAQPVVPKAPPQARTPAAPQATPALTPTPVAVPVTTPAAPSTAAPTVPAAAPAASAATAAASVNPRPIATTPTATAAVVLPSSDADYLNNPAPTYPSMSRRMGEQGTVLVRAFINTDGRAEKAEIRTSSGYSRLDESALATVQRWRYVPGQRAGVAEAMWFNVPIRFLLD